MNIDTTGMPPLNKILEPCEVVSIPAGATPKAIVVELPGSDGARIKAHWTGTPALIVGDFVAIQRRQMGAIQYVIVGTSGVTPATGGAEAATQAEVDAGTVADEYVSPLTLANYPPILLKVLNTTGGALTAGSMVYTLWVTGSGMEAKSPASASVLYSTTAAVVVVGGANNATVLVATRGRHSIFYSSTAPSIGDYLILGAANTVTRQTYMSPEVVAIAMAAGAGGG